jgi:hypothetical protein
MTARRPPVLLGRASEREALDRLLGNVRGGQSAVLVVRGEAGVGKTALLRYCARQASGFRVARIAGVESEMELPFAGLHQLCTPMLGRLGAVPEPQQAALGVALGLSSGAAPTVSWSPWPRSACWPRLPRSGRCSVSSMTPSGSMPPRRRSWDSSRDGCRRSRWRSSSQCVSRPISASWWACRSWRSKGYPRRTRVPSRAGSMSASHPHLLQRGRHGRSLRGLGRAGAVRHRGASRIQVTALIGA